jgi:hypothetical protein
MAAINKLALMDEKTLLGTTLGYDVADTYHWHRFDSHATGKRSPRASFEDDDLLRRAIKQIVRFNYPLNDSSIIWAVSMVSGTQACANFRPGFALAIYRKFGVHGGNVLDMSSGYGGRLVGWMASGLGGSYTGVDPSTAACAANDLMARDLGYANVHQHEERAEVVNLYETYDLAFTSPPYFTKEQYGWNELTEPLQSWWRYPLADDWRKGFLEPMLERTFLYLRSEAHCILNVQDVKIKTKVYPLTEWTVEAALRAGFVRTEHDLELRFTHRFGSAIEGTTEPVFVFRKP